MTASTDILAKERVRQRRETRRERLGARRQSFTGCERAPASLWVDVFANDAPVEVEIGPGTGTFVLAAARERPDTNFFAIERAFSRARRLQETVARRPQTNLRVLHADAFCVLRTVIPLRSVNAYHIYFPDPWWKRRHFGRRLFTPSFATALAETLVPGGVVHTATDVEEVFALVRDTLVRTGQFSCVGASLPYRFGVTSFERKGLLRGATIRQASYARTDS